MTPTRAGQAARRFEGGPTIAGGALVLGVFSSCTRRELGGRSAGIEGADELMTRWGLSGAEHRWVGARGGRARALDESVGGARDSAGGMGE